MQEFLWKWVRICLIKLDYLQHFPPTRCIFSTLTSELNFSLSQLCLFLRRHLYLIFPSSLLRLILRVLYIMSFSKSSLLSHNDLNPTTYKNMWGSYVIGMLVMSTNCTSSQPITNTLWWCGILRGSAVPDEEKTDIETLSDALYLQTNCFLPFEKVSLATSDNVFTKCKLHSFGHKLLKPCFSVMHKLNSFPSLSLLPLCFVLLSDHKMTLWLCIWTLSHTGTSATEKEIFIWTF